MDYYIGPDGELYHGLFGKGKPRDDHKYIKREWKNGRWQYTYQSNSTKTSVKSAKISSSLSNASKKIVSTARNIEAKAKLENRGKLSLQSRAALTKGRNALNSKTSKPKVSKEYQEEVAYNSKKNTFGNYKPISGESLASTNKPYISKTSKQSSKPKVSKEYQEESAYNSKKNVYPKSEKVIKENVIPEKVITEKVIKENVIPEKVITEKVIKEKVIPEKTITESGANKSSKKESHRLTAAKKKLDKFGDWASDKLSDVGDGLKNFGEDAVDWVGDRMGDLHDVTIGKVKDGLGYDDRDYMNRCAIKRDEAASDIDRAMERIETRIAAGNGKFTNKTKEGVEAKIKVFLTPACEDYAKFDADYTMAREKYDATPLGKIDSWINNRESSASKTDEAYAVQTRLKNDRTFQRAETDFIANQLACMAVNNYLAEHNKRDNVDCHKYLSELQGAGEELYAKLDRYAHIGMDLRRTDNSNIETDRIDRIILELEDMFDRTKR